MISFSLVGFQAQESKKLSPQDFDQKLKETNTFILVDVRTEEEYAKGHLMNAVLLDFYNNDFKRQLSKLDKRKPVFVYCAVGGRSGAAAKTLVELGFKQVYDLQGGIEQWRRVNMPVVK